jgi:plasmid stabilization system protein ParE
MRSKPFRFHPEASEDFRDAIGWYRTRSPLVATEFRVTVSDVIRHLVKSPHRWPKYLHGTRRFVLSRFPFSIIYLDDPDVLITVADKERADFAGTLIQRLDDTFDENAEAVWQEEIARRRPTQPPTS